MDRLLHFEHGFERKPHQTESVCFQPRRDSGVWVVYSQQTLLAASWSLTWSRVCIFLWKKRYPRNSLQGRACTSCLCWAALSKKQTDKKNKHQTRTLRDRPGWLTFQRAGAVSSSLPCPSLPALATCGCLLTPHRLKRAHVPSSRYRVMFRKVTGSVSGHKCPYSSQVLTLCCSEQLSWSLITLIPSQGACCWTCFSQAPVCSPLSAFWAYINLHVQSRETLLLLLRETSPPDPFWQA